jgi:hypothetical protein
VSVIIRCPVVFPLTPRHHFGLILIHCKANSAICYPIIKWNIYRWTLSKNNQSFYWFVICIHLLKPLQLLFLRLLLEKLGVHFFERP